MLKITQGDTAVFNLTAKDGSGTPFNITGATFETQIRGKLQAAVTFNNSKHAITNATEGQFTLTLNTTDTDSLGLGSGKDVVTKITQGGSVIYFHGNGILTVVQKAPLK